MNENNQQEDVPQWRILLSIILAVAFLSIALPFYLVNELFKKIL